MNFSKLYPNYPKFDIQFIKIKKEELLTPFFMPLTFAIQKLFYNKKI